MKNPEHVYDIDINTPLNPSFGMSDNGFIDHSKGDFELLANLSVDDVFNSLSNN